MLYAKAVIVLVLTLIALLWASSKFAEIVKMIRTGKAEPLTDHPLERWSMVFRMVFGHERLLKDPAAGVLHLFFLYGFLVLGAGHTELVVNGLTSFLWTDKSLGYGFKLDWLMPENLSLITHLYHFSQDFFAIAVIVMSVIALARRFSGKVKRLMPRSLDAEIILWFILCLYLSFYVYVPTRLAMDYDMNALGWQWWAPVSSLMAPWYEGMAPEALLVTNEFAFFTHLLIFLSFGVYLAFSKHMHVVFAGPNCYFYHREGPKGLPPKIDFADENLTKYGIDRVYEYSWKTLLDTFACTECGRCNAVCPAHLTGKPLQPKKVLHDLKGNLRYENWPQLKGFYDPMGNLKPDKAEALAELELKTPLLTRDAVDASDPEQVDPVKKTYLKVDGQIHVDEAWACTTCGACIDACPVLIDSVPGSLIGLRQNLVMMESDFPEELTAAFKGLENQGNPWGVGQDKREDWLEGLDVATMAAATEEGKDIDYLFWVGCAGSTDDRAKKTQKALVKVLKASNVNFAVLGCEEKCTGDPARRMGNEYVFDMLAQENAAVLEGYKDKYKKIFTSCPHCYNSLKNEYPQYGLKADVLHHTQLIAELLKDKRIPIDTKKAIEETVTFHDPCYMSRYNAEVDAPREIVNALPGVEYKEMERSHNKSFCCGAGGGRMWMEEHIGKRVNIERTEEALVTLGKKGSRSQTIAVGCPFCMTMLTDGTKAKDVEEDVKVKDIAEVLAERLA